MLAASPQGSERIRGVLLVHGGATAAKLLSGAPCFPLGPAPRVPLASAEVLGGSGSADSNPRHPGRASDDGGRPLVTAARALIFALVLSLAPDASVRGQELRDGLNVAYGNPPAPPLALEDVDGRVHLLSDLRGRVIVVNFWATWCPPCIAEMPAIQRMYDALAGQGVRVLAVNAGEHVEDIRSFVRNFEPALTFPLLRDSKGDTFARWRVLGLPHTFVVDPSGNLAYTAEGARQMDSPHILNRLRALLE